MSTVSNQFQPIEKIALTVISTAQAAYYLNRKPQTLRCWAMREDGLIRPLRINGRLGWPVAEVKRVLGIGQ